MNTKTKQEIRNYLIEHIDDYGFQHLNNIDLEILYDDYESEV